MVLEFIGADLLGFLTSFLFVFAVAFAALTYSGVLGRPKAPMAIIAFAVALASSLYEPFVLFMRAFIPIAVTLLVIIFLFAVVKKAFESKKDKKTDLWPFIIVLMLFVIVLGAVWNSVQAQFLQWFPGFSADSIFWMIGVAVFIAIFAAAYHGGKGGEGK